MKDYQIKNVKLLHIKKDLNRNYQFIKNLDQHI